MAEHDSVAADQLRVFIERIENVERDMEVYKEDRKEIYAELKGQGFDPVIIRQIVKIRKMDPNERAEQDALLSLYLSALGLEQVEL